MPRVVHFEIDAKKPEKAIKFYEKVFGWKIMKWEGTNRVLADLDGKREGTRHRRWTVEENRGCAFNGQHD